MMYKNETRIGDWMQTYTGRRYYPLDPRPEDISITDVSHALSLLCRYGGHIDRFYSVAEHCVLMSHVVPVKDALHALLHDATEAYVVDVPRPLKYHLSDYRDIENRVWQQIATYFYISPTLPDSVKDADYRILINEKRELMRNAERWEVEDTHTPLTGVLITGWAPDEAEEQFIKRFDAIMDYEYDKFIENGI